MRGALSQQEQGARHDRGAHGGYALRRAFGHIDAHLALCAELHWTCAACRWDALVGTEGVPTRPCPAVDTASAMPMSVPKTDPAVVSIPSHWLLSPPTLVPCKTHTPPVHASELPAPCGFALNGVLSVYRHVCRHVCIDMCVDMCV